MFCFEVPERERLQNTPQHPTNYSFACVGTLYRTRDKTVLGIILIQRHANQLRGIVQFMAIHLEKIIIDS